MAPLHSFSVSARVSNPSSPRRSAGARSAWQSQKDRPDESPVGAIVLTQGVGVKMAPCAIATQPSTCLSPGQEPPREMYTDGPRPEQHSDPPCGTEQGRATGSRKEKIR